MFFKSNGSHLKKLVKEGDLENLKLIIENDNLNPSESSTLVTEAMHSSYPDNLRIILTNGPNFDKRRKIFERKLGLLIDGVFPNLTLASTVLKRLIEWDLITTNLIVYLRKVFEKGNASSIKMLMETGIVEHVKQSQKKEDLTAHLFGNKNKIVMQVLKDRDFDVNAKGKNGRSALHFSARSHSKKNTLFLLDKGADINIKDNFGRTPLFESLMLMRILISRGADVQVINIWGFPAFKCDPDPPIKQKHILGQLAILEAQGLPISQDMQDAIQAKEKYKRRFDKYRSCVDQMKKYVVCKSVTMFTILSENPKDIERYVRNKRTVFKKAIDNYPLRTKLMFENLYYMVRINENVRFLLDVCKMRNRAIKIVAQNVWRSGTDHLIVQKIVDFLTYDDLCVMFK